MNMTGKEKRRISREIDNVLEWVGILKFDKYDKIARELGDVLLDNWDDATKKAIKDAIRALSGKKGSMKNEDIDAMIQQLAVKLGPSFAGQVAAPLYQAHSLSYEKGIFDVTHSISPSFGVMDEKALRVLDEHNVWWVRNQFNRNLTDKIRKLGKKVITEGMDYKQAGTLFEKEFAEQFQSYGTRYWRGFANHVVSRSSELGRVSGYEKAGIKRYEIRAVLDHRTTEICREMHGRVLQVKAAVDMRNQILDAKTPEDVLKVAPWMRADQVADVENSQLPTGMAIPPYHFRCRTRTVALVGQSEQIYDEAVQRVRGGKTLRDKEIAVQIIAQTLGKALLKMKDINFSIGTKKVIFEGKERKLSARRPGVTAIKIGSPESKKSVGLFYGKMKTMQPIETWDENENNIIDISNIKNQNSTGSILLHEIGHVLHGSINQLAFEASYFKNKPVNVSLYAGNSIPDKFAESFAAYMLGNRRLKRDFENNYKWVHDVAEIIGLKLRPFGFKGK